MSKQIFKQDISKNILLTFLENNADVTDKFYIFSKTNYRQADYHNEIETLCELIKPCYHVSKLHYIERKLTYSKFITISTRIKDYVDSLGFENTQLDYFADNFESEILNLT